MAQLSGPTGPAQPPAACHGPGWPKCRLHRPACIDWCGHQPPEAFRSLAICWLARRPRRHRLRLRRPRLAAPFARRLIRRCEAGEAAGRRQARRQSALLIHDGEDSSALRPARVDDHADPLTELAAPGGALRRQRWVHFRRQMPSRASASGLIDRGASRGSWSPRSIAEGYE